MTEKDLGQDQIVRAIQQCKSVLRGTTIGILTALGSIIVLTTISTSTFVQISAKGLFYLIVLQLLVSLVVWRLQARMIKRSESGDPDKSKPWPWWPWV